jgi:hypothetical protein
MKLPTSTSLRVLLLLSLLGIAGPGLAQTTKAPKPAGAILKGRITSRGKGVPGIVVYLRGQGFNPQASTPKGTSDLDGNYSIVDVPAGGYQVTPLSGVYALPDPKLVILADGETVEGFDFALTRGGVITGKVTDADNRPLIEERVNLSLADQPNAVRGQPPREMMVPQVATGTTDDRGIYRLYGLKPGRYRVSIGKGDRNFWDGSFGRRLYPQTYHPDTRDAEKATVIEVGEGTESSNVDIVVDSAIQTFSAVGRVVNADTNQGIAGIRIGLRLLVEGNPQAANFVNANAVTSAKGEFRFETLLPGRYATFVFGAEGQGVIADPVTFEVVDQDVSGLLIKSQAGAVISGVVTIEGTNDKTLMAKLTQLRLGTWVRSDDTPAATTQPTTLGSDGSFRVSGLPSGVANFSFAYTGESRAFSIRRIERDGVLQPQGIQVIAGEQINNVRIVVVYGNATVRGTIKLENGPAPPGTRFHVQVNQKPGEPPQFNPAIADERGRFLIEHIAAGSYELMVIANGPGIKKPTRVIQPVSITEGVNDITIVLDLDQPKP